MHPSISCRALIREILRLADVVKTDTYGSVFEDRTEELFAFLQCLLGTLAFRDVFRQGDEVLWLAYSVSEQLKPPVASNDAAVAADEAVLVLVGVSLTLDDCCIPFRAGDALIGMNNPVPLLQSPQLFCPE